jgi:hypothetical protein
MDTQRNPPGSQHPFTAQHKASVHSDSHYSSCRSHFKGITLGDIQKVGGATALQKVLWSVLVL